MRTISFLFAFRAWNFQANNELIGPFQHDLRGHFHYDSNSYFCGAMLSTNHVEPLIPPLV